MFTQWAKNVSKNWKCWESSIKGSYDLSVTRSINVLFENCRQTNDVNDETYWGIFGSNYSKNLIFENCTLSRFDAHMGVYNATIRNSTLGYMGIKLIGFGQFLIENSTIGGENLVSLRQDYGSTWKGNFKIKNCVFIPSKTKSLTLSLFLERIQVYTILDIPAPCQKK